MVPGKVSGYIHPVPPRVCMGVGVSGRVGVGYCPAAAAGAAAVARRGMDGKKKTFWGLASLAAPVSSSRLPSFLSSIKSIRPPSMKINEINQRQPDAPENKPPVIPIPLPARQAPQLQPQRQPLAQPATSIRSRRIASHIVHEPSGTGANGGIKGSVGERMGDQE